MIQDLRLQKFRSYQDASFEFEPGVNIIVGPNASGKTNLLEALLFVSRGRSFRARDAEIMAHKASWSRLDSQTLTGPRIVKLQITPFKPEKSFDINNQQFKRLPHNRQLPVVLFEPSHLALLTSGPDLRRDYLDDILEVVQADFSLTRRQYKRALAQRNSLLKQPNFRTDALFVWDVRLSEIAQQLVRRRMALITKMNKRVQKIYQGITHAKDTVKINYESELDTQEYGSVMLKQLGKKIEEDKKRGFTSVGPHRDDVQILLNKQPIQISASRGEVRSLLLTLKIVETELIEVAYGQKPVLLLDDVFSELDGGRRRALTEVISGHQTFITTTDADIVLQHFTDKSHIIAITAAH